MQQFSWSASLLTRAQHIRFRLGRIDLQLVAALLLLLLPSPPSPPSNYYSCFTTLLLLPCWQDQIWDAYRAKVPRNGCEIRPCSRLGCWPFKGFQLLLEKRKDGNKSPSPCFLKKRSLHYFILSLRDVDRILVLFLDCFNLPQLFAPWITQMIFSTCSFGKHFFFNFLKIGTWMWFCRYLWEGGERMRKEGTVISA